MIPISLKGTAVMISGEEKIKLQMVRGRLYDLSLKDDEIKRILKQVDDILDYDFDSWLDDVPF